MIKLKNILLEMLYDKKSIIGYYNDVCKSEHISPILIKFYSVGHMGASLQYNSKLFKPEYIGIDLLKLTDPEYAILHELAHQVMLDLYKDPNHTSKFKTIFNHLINKYMYSDISMKWFK